MVWEKFNASNISRLWNTGARFYRKQLSAYLEYGEAAMTNNICEWAIRNFTIGRKNWLFSASPKGAEASATIYSIIETCKAPSLVGRACCFIC